MNKVQNQYTPDYVSPPGETLLEVIDDRQMSQAELATRMGRPKKTINEIIQGKTAITPETALQLERVLGISASFWNNREQQYRQYQARTDEQERLTNYVGWMKKFPIKAMVKLGWIDTFDNEVQQLDELLKFFGVASPEQWDVYGHQCPVSFRKSQTCQSELEAIAVWLRQGEIEAHNIHCQPYDAKQFRQTLKKVRALTLDSPEIFQDKLVDLCAKSGVAVVFVPQIPKARVSGATRWLSPKKALIQLSLRYKTDDHFWFTFFHEAGHILLHGKREIFLEDEQLDGTKENEANEFAAKALIPPAKLISFLNQLTPGYYPSKHAIKEFAKEIGVSPGIIVGRLQHDKHLPFTHCNDLKQTFVWIKQTFEVKQ